MTGVVRRTDRLGRVCLPREMRRVLEIGADTPVEILLDRDSIVVKRFTPGCMACGGSDMYKSSGVVRLCKTCFTALAGC
jgi:transcriptional pleiotropic regulator of transition state genes